jgi:signal peptidase I
MRLLPLVAAAAAAAAIPAMLAAARLRSSLVAVRVVGISMQPTLLEGERVLVRRTTAAEVRRGQLVVFAHPPTPSRPAFSRPPTLVDQTRGRAPRRPRPPRPPPQLANRR